MVRALALLAALAAAAPAGAECRLALVLALDVSSSVNAREDRLQRDGVASALLSPEVRAALLAAPETPVALAVYEWSGRYQQDMVLNWLELSSPGAILRAARTVQGSKRRYAEFPTAMGYGIGYAAKVFRAAPDCLARTLDVSGDGVNNDGFGPRLAYENFALDGVTVNGLAIGGATENDREVFDFYRDEVIRGPGAFVETATSFADYERVMRRKLFREVQSRVVGGASPAVSGG